MRIVKHGIIPRRIRMACNCCGCIFIEKGNKVAIYDRKSYIKLTTYCPQCGEYVWATVNKPGGNVWATVNEPEEEEDKK